MPRQVPRKRAEPTPQQDEMAIARAQLQQRRGDGSVKPCLGLVELHFFRVGRARICAQAALFCSAVVSHEVHGDPVEPGATFWALEVVARAAPGMPTVNVSEEMFPRARGRFVRAENDGYRPVMAIETGRRRRQR